VAVGVDERGRVGGGVEEAVEGSRVLRGACEVVEAREGPQRRGVLPEAEVVEAGDGGIGGARDEVQPALVAPVGGGARAARGVDREGDPVPVVAEGVGDAGGRRGEARGDAAVEVGGEPGDALPRRVPRRVPAASVIPSVVVPEPPALATRRTVFEAPS
jgi:hypothetical protein